MIDQKFLKNKVFILFSFIIFVSLSLFLRWNSFGFAGLDDDEGIYLLMGRFILEGHLPYVHYWDHQPPLIYYLSACADFFFKDGLFGIRFLGAVFIGLTSMMISLFLKQQTSNSIASLCAGVFYLVLLSVDFLDGLAFNNEIIFNLFTISSLFCLCFVLHSKKNNSKLFFIAGLIMGLGLLTKQNVIFDYVPFVLYIVIYEGKSFKERIRSVLFFIFGSSVPHFLFLMIYLFSGHAYDYVLANLMSNFFYIQNESISLHTINITYRYLKTLFPIIPFCFLWLVLPMKRKVYSSINHDRGRLFIFIWFLCVFAGTNVSKTFYLHYYIQLYLVISVMLGLSLNRMLYLKSTLLRSFLILFNLLYFFFFFKNSQFPLNQPKQKVNDLRDAAEYIKNNSKEDDTLYVVDGDVILYYLADFDVLSKYAFPIHLTRKKYAQAFQIDQFIEMKKILDQNPTWVVIEDGSPYFYRDFDDYIMENHLSAFIKNNYTLNKEFIPEGMLHGMKVYKLNH